MKPFIRHQKPAQAVATADSMVMITTSEAADTLELIISGEYYTAFSIVDCFVLSTSIIIFIVLEGFFIGQAATAHYAVPFIFLQIIPIYGFVLSIVSMVLGLNKSYGPGIFNALLFVLMSLSFTTSMLHVCAIPGVTSACATSIPHTVTATNILVSAPLALLVFFASMGLVYSSYTPSFLVNRDCVNYTTPN
jgi:hypothetical protein